MLDEGYRVLVVDDEPIVHSMMERILCGCGLPVALAGTASSGEEAIQKAHIVHPQICLLDIQMGEMNGFELASRLGESLGYQPAVIFITAYRRFEYAQQAIRLGAVDYVVKPIRRENVIEALRATVSRLQAERLERIEKERIMEILGSIMPAAVTPDGPAACSRVASIARAAREFVDEHYSEPITLSTVADRLSLSSGYLGQIFKADSGVSFRAYLRRVRVTRAKELMTDLTLNLSQIADRVGYDDISYFSRSFLEETGVRPNEYRGGGRRWPR